jgi:peptidyl-prolyl cis-trans isomerase D
MIEWFHRVSKSWLATLLMGALALSFVIWGVADVFTGQSATALATVGGTEIDGTAFQRTYRNFMRSEGQRMGIEISPDMAQKMGLGQVAMQQMISRAALDNYAEKEGLVASDAQVVSAIHEIPGFRGPTGQFDHASFLNAIQAAGYNEAEFIQEVREDMTRTQLTSAIESFYGAPTEYSLALYLYLNEKRAADYVVVPPEAAGTIAPPDEKTLADFVKANAARFSTPEYRDVSFAWAAPADVPVEITDKMIADEYAARNATYNVPEKRQLSQLDFKDEAAARAARAKLDAGTSFDALAQSMGLKPADTALGEKTKADLGDPAVADAAFAVKEGETSQPVKGTFGWVLVRTTKITVPGVNHPLEEVKDQVRANLQTQLAAGKLVDMMNAYDDAHRAGADLPAAAKKAGLKVGHVAAMDSKGLAPDGSKTDAPADPDFLAAAFKSDVGADNDPVSAKSGAYYVVKVNGITPPKLKPLDEVRADAVAQWTLQKRRELLAAKVKTLTEQAQKEKSLAGVAAALKATVEKSPALSRTTDSAATPAALVGRLFDAKPNAIVSAPAGEGYVIAQLTGIAHPKPDAATAKDFQAAAQQLATSIAGDFSIAIANHQRTVQRVRVNQQLLDTAIGNGS